MDNGKKKNYIFAIEMKHTFAYACCCRTGLADGYGFQRG